MVFFSTNKDVILFSENNKFSSFKRSELKEVLDAKLCGLNFQCLLHMKSMKLQFVFVLLIGHGRYYRSFLQL